MNSFMNAEAQSNAEINQELIDTLTSLRGQIDVVDDHLISLLWERLTIVQKIGLIKRENHMPVTDQGRETQVIESVCHRGESIGLDETFITNLFQLIMNESKRIQL